MRKLSSKMAKRRVVAICEVLAAANPRIPDKQIQDAAIDLHDIEVACQEGLDEISRLRRHSPKKKGETRTKLISVDVMVLDQLTFHISSLRRFFRKIGIRDTNTGR